MYIADDPIYVLHIVERDFVVMVTLPKFHNVRSSRNERRWLAGCIWLQESANDPCAVPDPVETYVYGLWHHLNLTTGEVKSKPKPIHECHKLVDFMSPPFQTAKNLSWNKKNTLDANYLCM